MAFSDNDVVLLCNVANSPFAYIPRMFGKPVVLNVDGLDRKREKWRGLGAQVLHFCEWMSSFSSNQLVTDAKAIHDYYLEKYGSESVVIGYGSEAPESDSSSEGAASDHSFNGFNLEAGRYVLYVSRLEPENNPDLVLRAWRNVRSDWPLVVVGDNPYKPNYLEQLKSLGDERVRFLGAIYGDGYWALQKHAGVFVFACEIGGVHPALIEAMAAGNAVLYLDTPRERGDRRRRRDAVRKIRSRSRRQVAVACSTIPPLASNWPSAPSSAPMRFIAGTQSPRSTKGSSGV